MNDYVDVSGIELPEFEERMTMTGTKVESIQQLGGEIEGIVVAEVLSIEPHPNADNLSMVEISTGDETSRVVCGAKNFSVGDRVPYAALGSRLPGLEITARKIRGEVSKGMLCSGSELGISKDGSGLLILQPDAPLGGAIVPLLGLDDVIVEFEITPNRPDCLSIIGIAREVAAVFGRDLKIPEAGLETEDLECPTEIEIADPTGCPRYLARYLEGVKVGPSPAWMAARLLAAGVRPISNIVDATNYVLMETGQPLHAFDATKIGGNKIIVRRAKAGEKLTTLDDVERTLDEQDLVIADATRALALAGVMGGEDSEVSDDTTSVVLECAAFDSASVAFTSRRHGLRTEASARFERGTNVEAIPYAAARCARFMKEMAGGRVARREPDEHPVVQERAQITLRPQRTNAVLGMDVPSTRQAEHLRAIGIDVTEGEVLETVIPPFRPDLVREADLIEEVARLEGYEKLPSTVSTGPAGYLTAEQHSVRRITRTLGAQGMTEAWTSSFFAKTDLDLLGLDGDHPARRVIEVSNPMVEQEGVLRSTMLPGLLRSVARNAAHHVQGVGLFEIANIYEPTTGDLAEEQLMLGAVMSGDRVPKSWRGPAERWDFFSAKGVLESAVASLGISGLTFDALAGQRAPFHPTRGALVQLPGVSSQGREPIGVIGELHPEACLSFDVPEGTCVFEVALAPVLTALPDRVEAQDLPRYPSVLIDLALVVEEGVAAGKVQEIVEKAGAPDVVRVHLFDLYRGDQVPDGRKSLAFSLEMRSPTQTMTDEDSVAVRDRIVNALAERFGAELRA